MLYLFVKLMKNMAVCESVYWKRGRGVFIRDKGLFRINIKTKKKKIEIPHFEFTKLIDKRQFSDLYCSVTGMEWDIIYVLQTSFLFVPEWNFMFPSDIEPGRAPDKKW